jgi:hypothetical protein
MPFLTIDAIRQYTSASTFEEAYLAVVERKLPTTDIVSLEGLRLKYSSRDIAAKTVIHLRPLGGIEKAECDCVVRGPLWCRHIAMALLVVLYEPESVIRTEAMEKAMDVAEKTFLQELLVHHCTVHPEFSLALTKALKEKLPQLFVIEAPQDYVPSTSASSLFEPPKEGTDPKKIILSPMKKRTAAMSPSATAPDSSERRTDWRPEFLIDPEKFMERSGLNPKLDAKKFGSYIREFTVDYGNRTFYGPGSSCPHYCYQYQIGQNCPHTSGGTIKVGNAPQINELFDAVDLLWQNGDVVNALEAMCNMTTGLSEATHRLHRHYSSSKPEGLYMIATRLADKWCRLILSCPKSALEEANVKAAITDYVAHIAHDRDDPTEPIFRGALLCLENHWSNPALVKLLDAAFGKNVFEASAAGGDPDFDPMLEDVVEVAAKPSTRQTKSKKRKRNAEPETPKAVSKAKEAETNAAYEEPLVAVAARLRFFAEVGNRTAWNALARWVIASIGAGKSAPSVQDCKIIADALVAHSALGALAFLSGPVRNYSASHSTSLTIGQITEICELLVNVAGKCCTPELKQRRSAPLSSLVVRCATLVAPHLWDSLEDSDQVTNLLDYPPEITDLVTLELAIQAISSLARSGEFSISHMIWKLLRRIETQCDPIAAADAALAAFPSTIIDSTDPNVSAPPEIRGRSIANWDKECCITLLDSCYSLLPVPKRRAAVTKAVDVVLGCKKLSVSDIHAVLRKLIGFYNALVENPIVSLDLTEEPKAAAPAAPKTPKSAKAAAAAAKAQAAATSAIAAAASSETATSLEAHLCDLIWKLALHGLTKKSPCMSRTVSYYEQMTQPNEAKLKTDFYDDATKFIGDIPKLRLAQTSIPADEKAMRRALGKAAMAADCEDVSEILLRIAGLLPVEEPDTIRMAARSFEVAAKLSSRQSTERRYNGTYQIQMEFEEDSSKRAQAEALRWLEKAIKLPPKERDPELIVSLLKGVYSLVPDVDTFQKIESLIMPPETLSLLKLTLEHRRSIRQSLVETLKEIMLSHSQVKCERAAVLCLHLGLLPDSLPAGTGGRIDLVPVLPKLFDYIANKGKNQYWFDLLIQRLSVTTEANASNTVRLLGASRILLDKGRWDLSVKIQGDAIVSQARYLSSQSSDYTKFVVQLDQFKTACIDANAADKFQEVYNSVITTPNVARKPKLVAMIGGKDINIKGAVNTKAKNALEKAVKAAKEKVAKGAEAKQCGACFTMLSNKEAANIVECPKCHRANCMLLD